MGKFDIIIGYVVIYKEVVLGKNINDVFYIW